MVSASRVEARLRLVALIQGLPLEADLELAVKGLSREEFNLLPGRREFSFGFHRRRWTKDSHDDGVTVEYYTLDPPLTDWDELARRESLRVIPGGQQ